MGVQKNSGFSGDSGTKVIFKGVGLDIFELSKHSERGTHIDMFHIVDMSQVIFRDIGWGGTGCTLRYTLSLLMSLASTRAKEVLNFV